LQGRIAFVFKGAYRFAELRLLFGKGGLFGLKPLLLLLKLRLLLLKLVDIVPPAALARVTRTETNKEPSISAAKTTAIIFTSFLLRFICMNLPNRLGKLKLHPKVAPDRYPAAEYSDDEAHGRKGPET
jgi:hypothetical protein